MTPTKLATFAAAGILLLGGVAILFISLEPGARRDATGGADGSAPASPGTIGPGGLPLPAGAGATPAPPGPLPEVVMGPPPSVPPEGSWEAVPPAARASAMGDVGPALGRELNELQPALAACFDEDVQARHGTAGFTSVQDQAPSDDHGTTILMLQVETQAGSARIVDAPVETRGRASDGLIACAQRVLRGRRVSAPGVVPGKRYRLLFTLLP